MLKRFTILLLLCSALAMAQGTEVVLSQAPPPNLFQIVYGYSGANNIYVCYARSRQINPSGPISISAATNASPVVFTSTSHGFNANSRPSITIRGGTGNWTPINGTFTATIVDANSFSIPVDSTTFGALTGTITFTSFAPMTNQSQWAVKLNAYDGSSNLISVVWLVNSSGFHAKCSDATSTTVNAQ